MARLEFTKRAELGGRTYRTRGVFANELALLDLSEVFEPWLDAVYRAVLKCRKGTFVDVGANAGQTMLKILAIDSARPYVGFEPQPWGCSFIQNFIEENDLRSHTILPFGLSNRTQLVKLYIRNGGVKCAGYESMSSTIEHFRPDSFYSSSRLIPVMKGDEAMAQLQLPSICAIKIDVEGGELEVVEGLSETIRAETPPVIFEVLNHCITLPGQHLNEQTIQFRQGRVEQIESLLRGQGYQIYNVSPGNVLKRVKRIEPGASNDLSSTNYLAISPQDEQPFLQAVPVNVSGS